MDLFFKELGEGHPFIILHGLFGSSDNWLTLGKKFAEKHKVYLVDLRNHGNSFHDETFNYKVMAEDILGFMNDHNIEEAFVLGHSMGGKVAMNLAVKNAERVTKLIVADISPAAYPVRHDVIVEALASINLDNVKTRQDADTQLQKLIPEVGVRQFLLKNLQRNKEGGYEWKINLKVIEREINKVGEPINPEASFSKPTLFVKGGRSKYILDKDLPIIQSIFKHHKLEIINEAGHWLHAEQPDAFFEIVDQFLTAENL